MSNEVNRCFVGIDVSKNKIDIHIRPHNLSWTQGNSSFKSLIKELKKYTPELIVLEPTGGYELGVMGALVGSGFTVSREHARRVYHHAKAMGKLAKTDKIDASVISHYAQSYCEDIKSRKRTKKQLLLSDLISRRGQLEKMETQEKNRLEKMGHSKEIGRNIEKMLRHITREIEELDKKIDKVIKEDKRLKEKYRILKSVKGIGDRIASSVLALLPELGELNRKEVAALVGVAPYKRESGKQKGREITYGGRRKLRSLMYMGIMTTIRLDEKFKSFYEKLLNKGKKKKVAQVACMHKLLRILNVMVANNECYKSA